MENPDTPIEHHFPPTRPNVEIVESGDTIDWVDHAELRWWLAVPRPGERTMRASYDADTLELAWIVDMKVARPARVGGIECVEMRADEWSAEDWRKTNSLIFYARVEDDTESRWVAVLPEGEDGRVEPFTLLDEHFESQWGASANPARKLYDDGRYRLLPNGSYETTSGNGLGAGTYDVTIGGNTFRCLRVLEPDLSEPGGGN